MKKGLGRGINALLGYGNEENTGNESQPNAYIHTGTETAPATGGVLEMDIRKIEPGKQQPRQFFDEGALRELSESIKAYGVIQPLIVRDCGDYYSIIAGERRYRAARMAKLTTLPVIVKEYSEADILQIALIENIQRQDLTPIEEANCYKRLMDDYFFTAEAIAEKVGKNKHAVAGLVRLLELDERVHPMTAAGKLSASHAQLLLNIDDGDAQLMLAEQITNEGLSVRAAEKLINTFNKDEQKEERTAPPDEELAAAYRRVSEDLIGLLGTKVNIKHQRKQNKGKIEIEYHSPEELDRLLVLIKKIGGV
jgi:ParB family chromosome partitioning protein